MVNEFSQYAREPKLKLNFLDLNKLIQEVLELYETTSTAEGELHSYIRLALTPNLPLLKETQQDCVKLFIIFCKTPKIL